MRREPFDRLSASDPEDAIVEAASDWLVRLSSGAHAPREQASFEAWLAIDTRHGEAYDALSQTWEDVGSLRHLRALADPDPIPPAWVRWLRAVGKSLSPAPIASGLAAAVAAAAFFTLSPNITPPDAAYATPVAQTRSVTLPDGSVVTLGAASHIEVRFSDNERRVTLTSGEAFFEVAHNKNRPFFVEAGDAVVRVVGTKFDVHRGQGRVAVSVLEGVVQVSNDERTQAMRVLRAGQGVEVEQRPVFFVPPPPPSEVQSVRAAPAGAWREGRLSYDDARLADLVADLNRYYAPGVTLAASADELRVTTSFRTDEIPAFLDALGTVLPVTVEERDDRSFAIGAHLDAN